MSVEQIRELEALAVNAWPAAEVEELDGWRLRFSAGVTRRANSVWPNAAGGRLPLAEKLAHVEQFYAERGCGARYQLCPAAQPADLDGILADRGYTRDALTAVQVAPLSTVLARTGPKATALVEIAECLDEAWFSTYCQSEAVGSPAAEVRRGILQRIAAPAAYALLRLEGQPAALGLGVLERGWLGLFCMATRPEFRRQGLAAAALHALAAWGQDQHATCAYLQVMENNAAARAVYARAGFETVYHYHYRESAPPPR